MAVVKKPNEVM